jgi:biopolymer transport protein TolR
LAFSGSDPSRPQMNVTPLIDVLLVLIIIFMVVVINERPTGLKAEIPQPAPPVPNNVPLPDRTIVIRILRPPANEAKPASGKNGGANSQPHPLVKINEEVVTWDRLRERLREIFAIRVERIAFIEADDDIEFQEVAEVIATAKIAGVDRVGLLTEDGKHAPLTGQEAVSLHVTLRQATHLFSKSTGSRTSTTRKYLASAGYFATTASYIAYATLRYEVCPVGVVRSSEM